MKLNIRILALATIATPLATFAQSVVTFEDETTYKGISVYDNWPSSPFRADASGNVQLKGNVAVVKNHLNATDEALNNTAANSSEKILAIQRSRFGSNTFGARIDLNETFELTTTTKYVHVLINKPREGRVMLMGLGKRTERADQSKETEQFWVTSSNTITPDKWCDAVFPINGAGGIDIYSLVVVPDCESTHNLTADFAAYIDDIEISNNATPRISYGNYPINYETDTKLSRTDRYTNSISMSGSADGLQTITVNQQTSKLLYTALLDQAFTAKAGETLTPKAAYTPGTWMHTYVYLDKNQDGKFDTTIDNDGKPTSTSEIVTYSYYDGKNSLGEEAAQGSSLNPPAFTLPTDLADGFYRLRYKVDWDNIDAGGNVESGNNIDDNGGAIIDVRLNVHSDNVTISRTGGLNGDLTTEDGEDIQTITAPFGKAFTLIAKPAAEFKISYLRVRHGHNLSGDSLIHETPQYEDIIYPAYAFKDGKLTIPAEVIDGDVVLEPYFVNPGTTTDTSRGDYPLNFTKELATTRTDRKLNSVSFSATTGGSTKLSITKAIGATVYCDMLSKQVSVVPGDDVATTISFTGSGLHAYLYVDLDQDGQFDTTLSANGTPTVASELLAYTYYKGHNSLGEEVTTETADASLKSLPQFTIPASLPVGVYRARFKVDYDDIDPAGQWSSDGGENQIDQSGGQIVDFLLNVHNVKHALTINTVNGSLNGSSTNGLPLTTTCFSGLTVVPSPVASGFVADSITIKHGHNLSGAQYIHGNRQWSEYKRKCTSSIVIPKDSVNGDLIITADFEPDGSELYELVFNDEFDGADGSMPDATKWTRCTRQSPTWKRFLSSTDEEHALTGYIEDGQFVARCLPNPFQDTDDVDMISGGIESSGKFSFQYGKIEARLMTNPYTGNFPAFWLMPQSPSVGWPYCGEIDIWEQIDSENISYHTIHSKWANGTSDGSECQGQSNNPKKSGSNANTTNGNYHTFGLERTDKLLTWYVDGKKVFSYAKSDDESDLELGQWPFDQYFYIILNQSVGNGSWAAAADVSHTYETRFDWVRVYKKNEVPSSIATATASSTFEVMTAPKQIRLAIPNAMRITIADVSGRVVLSQEMQGNKTISVERGIYIVNGKKVFVP